HHMSSTSHLHSPPSLMHLFPYHHTPPPSIYTLSLHDALPIFRQGEVGEYTQVLEDARRHAIDRMLENARLLGANGVIGMRFDSRSEEHTSELQSRFDLVCRLLLEKKKMVYIYKVLMSRVQITI